MKISDQYKLLLIDDEPMVLKMMERVLYNPATYKLFSAINANHALEMLDEQTFDIIISDHIMPEITGVDFFNKIKTEHPDTFRILVTGKADHNDILNAINMGEIFRIFLKPINAPALKHTIDQIIKQLDTQKILQEKLKQSENRFEILIESQTDAIIVTGTEGDVLYVNQAAEDLWGRKRESFIGQPSGLPVISGESLEIEIFPQNGPVVVGEMKTLDTLWKEKKALISSIRDITEQKQLHQEIVQSNSKLKEAVGELKKANKAIIGRQNKVIEHERLKLMLQLAGDTLYELKQPIRIIKENIELIRGGWKTDLKPDQQLYHIETASDCLGTILEKISLLKSNPDTSSTKPLPVNSIKQNTQILCIVNKEPTFNLIAGYLGETNQFHLSHAGTLSQAHVLLQQNKFFDVIMLDYWFPDGNGLDFLLGKKKLLDEIPIIVMTGQGEEAAASKMIQAGADYYLPVNDMNARSLIHAIDKTIEKFQLNVQAKNMNQELIKIAYHDALTGCYSRRYFMETLEKECDGANRYNQKLCLCMFDIDRFKIINDTYGHICGDMVLKTFGSLLMKNRRASDTPARYGGEEIMVILPSISLQQAFEYAQRIRQMLEKHLFSFGDKIFSVTTSAGVASINSCKNLTAMDLIGNCDKALYRAKKQGRNQVVCFR